MSHKRLKSKKKEDKKLLKKNKKLAVKRDIYNQIFDFLEIRDEILKLSKDLRNNIYNFSWPKIAVDISQIASDYELSEKVELEINEEIENYIIKVSDKFLYLSAVHYAIGLRELVLAWLSHVKKSLNSKDVPEKRKKEVINLNNLLNEINSKISPIIDSIYKEYPMAIASVAGKIINAYFNFENGLYPELLISRTPNQKPFPVIKVCKLNLKKETLKTEEGERNAYKGHAVSLQGLDPIFFEPNTIGNSEKIPVYIQDHAIFRLKERVSIKPEGYLLDCLTRSLISPKLCGKDGDSYLVEFNLYEYKLGYLLVRKEKDYALVKSFKFITMTGTPEFMKVTKMFRATKHDVTYLGLDTLDVFMNSDLANDQELRKIFEECDLGHLFELSEIIQNNKEIAFQSSKQNVVDEIKQYFNF